jgi:hypothetical protein
MTTRRITPPREDQSVDSRRDDRERDGEPQMSPLSPADQSAQQMFSSKAFTMHLEHQEFLNRVSTGDDATITPETASKAGEAWQQIWLASGGKIPLPSACTNADGKVFYSWDCGRYHLDLDIIPGEPAAVFFCDRETDEYWCEDYRIGDPLPSEVVSRLNLFA